MKKKSIIILVVLIVLTAIGIYFYRAHKEVNIYREVLSKAEQQESFSITAVEDISYENGIDNTFYQKSLIEIDKKNHIHEKTTLKTNYTNEKTENYYDTKNMKLYSSLNDYKEEELIHANNINTYICTDLLNKLFNAKDIVQKKNGNEYIVETSINNPNDVICNLSVSNDNLFNSYGYVAKASCPVVITINKNYEIKDIKIDLSKYVKAVASLTSKNNINIEKSTLNYSFNYKNISI